MRMRWIVLAALVVGAAGCAADGGLPARAPTPDFSRFAHSWAAQHVTLYWDCAATDPGMLRLEGVAVNKWEPIPPRFLNLNLTGLDAQGRALSQAQGAPRDVEITRGFPASFRLDLREQGGEVRFDLAFRYDYRDDSFDRFSRLVPMEIRGRIPDACGQGGRQPQ